MTLSPIASWSLRRRALAGALSGVAVASSLPPVGAWWLGLAGLGLLGVAFSHASAKQGFLAGWCAGASASLVAGAWVISLVPRFTSLPLALGVLLWALLALWTGLTWGLAGALSAWGRASLGGPLAAACGLLVAERWGPSVFPFPLAVGLVDVPWIPQCADLVGVTGVGALLLAVAVALATGRSHRGRAVAAGVVLTMAVYGAVRAPVVRRARALAPVVRFGLVQPAVPAVLRWEAGMQEPILARLQGLTRATLSRDPEVVLWHEGAYPYELPFRGDTDGRKYPAVWTGRDAPPIVFGAVGRLLGSDGGANAVFVRTREGVLREPVSKRWLLPFGEYVPWVGWIGPVRRAFYRAEGLVPGERPEVLPAGRWTLGVLVCFEDILPVAGAEVARSDVLVNLTNDAWFDGAAGAQHLVAARWRGIEARRDLVRAVNTGRSGVISALGEALVTLPDGPREATVDARARPSLRPLAPWVIPWSPWAALALLSGGAGWRRFRRPRAR